MRQLAEAAASQHKRNRSKHIARWEIPIVNRNRRIIGWTNVSPESVGTSVRHSEAERLTGGPVTATYIQISDGSAAERAGAPVGWDRPWRCLGIIAVGDADGPPCEHVPLLEVEV